MSATMAQILEAGRQQAGLTNRELWIGFCGLGGNAAPAALDAYLTGDAIPSNAEYDMIAQALNDIFVVAGKNHPVPYAEDLTP
jgi:hypothetical protein